MNLSKTSLNLWLKQQQQLVDGCSSAVLLRTMKAAGLQWIASAPEDTPPDAAWLDAANQVLAKQRVVTAKHGDYTLLATPILLNQQVWGVIVLQLDGKQDLRTSVKVLKSGLTWLKFLLAQPDAKAIAKTSPQNPRAEWLLQFANKLLHDQSLRETCISLVNLLATQLQSIRVSIGLKNAREMELIAVSFLANFDTRTEAMQQICAAMDEAADQQTNVNLPGDNVNRIVRKHEELQQAQSAGSVHSFLLYKDTQLLGAITLEQPTQDFSDEQRALIRDLLELATEIISLKKNNEATLRQQLGHRVHKRWNSWLGERHVTRKLTAIGGLALLAWLIFPADYWVASDAKLISSYRYLVVSPQDGYLASIKARPGTAVKQGELLAQLKDEDLRLEQRKQFSQQQQAMQEYDNALANANRVQAAIANEKVAQASSQLQLIEQQQSRTQLVAPSDGIITSDDISQSLGAPVKQGQTLFEISAPQGYLVQLFVDERDIAPIQPGQTGKLKLTSAPGEIFEFTVKIITPISEVREGKNCFVVEASLNREAPVLRPGMTGTGKILADKKSHGWIWLHDIWYWLRLKLWL